MPKRPANDPHFTWQGGDVTWNIPLESHKEAAVPKRKLIVRHGMYAWPEEREDFVTKETEVFDSPTLQKVWEVLAAAASLSLEVSASPDGSEITISVADRWEQQ